MKKLHLLALLLLMAGDTVLSKDAANSPLQVKEENSPDQGNQTTTIGFTTSAFTS